MKMRGIAKGKSGKKKMSKIKLMNSESGMSVTV
jgi:hypothetical protein